MTIFRVEHSKNYTVVNRFINTDKRLSMKAKGIWMYAFSRPDDWIFHIKEIITNCTDGTESIKSGLRELENTGYLVRNQNRVKGKFDSADWVFYEVPQLNPSMKTNAQKTENTPTVFTPTEKTPTENRSLLNTEDPLSIDKINNNRASEDAAVPLEKPKKQQKQKDKIHPCLEGVDIPIKEKIWITKKYHDEECVKNAIEWATNPQTEVTTTLVQAIKWACRESPEIPKSKLASYQENKEYAKKYDGLRSGGGIRVECYSDGVLFLVSDNGNNPTIDYSEGMFTKKLEETLVKYGFKVFQQGRA